ncbi:MAG: MBL fold metallo-hydrolase [Eubacteriales bacterium]|nr:MBL fold metallo-hydrolase [Eubacteriales bacterium]
MPEAGTKARLYQLDNAGFAIVSGNRLLLVDALHPGSRFYGGLSQEALALIRRLASGASKPVPLFITHLHADHAGEAAIRETATEIPLVVYTADPAILGWDLGAAEVTLLPLDEDAVIGDVLARAIALPHLRPERYNILHTALSLQVGGASVFVSGDGLLDERVYERNAPYIKGAGAAVCLYSYAFTRHNLAFAKAHIAPHILIANHFPHPDLDKFDTLTRFKAYIEKENEGMTIIPFSMAGDGVEI